MAEQNNRIQFLKDALKNLSSAVREVSGGLIDLEKVISRLSGKTREFAKEQQTAAQSVNRVGKNLKDTAKTVDEYSKNTDKASKSQKGLFGGLRRNLRTIVQFYGAYQVLNLAISAFRELVVGSARRAIELEKALKDVAAVANLTSKDMDRLETVVFKVAGTTSLTAIEVVALQKELAKLGTSVSDIEKLTGPIALLSQALGEEPGGVAATLKKTLNQFQATSTESERFSNILLGAVNETALSLNDLGTALGYVGPLGAQLGVSFEETASLLGILADNGFKASKAGTGLRSFFIAAAKDGRPFNEFLEDVGDRSLNATEAVETFGKIAASQALVLGKNVDRYKELSDSLGDVNRLLKANADQMSSTQGQIDLLSSAYNRASIRLGDFITQTEFFIELIELLDPATAGQARAFKLISNASEDTEKSLDKLGKSLINFKETEEEAALSTQQILFETLKNSGAISEDSAKVIEREVAKGREVLEIMEKRAELVEYAEDELLLAEALLDIYGKSAKTQRDLRIEEEARNENYKEAEKLTNKLTQAAKEGVLTDKEQERVTKGLSEKLTQLQEAREKSRDKEEIIILEKRIALFKELETTVKNLENSEAAIEEKKQARIDADKKEREQQIKDIIKRIKEQEKIIKEELSKDISDEQFLTQVELLNSIFGDADDIISEAERLYGKNSDFVKGLRKVFEDAAEGVTVGIPKVKNTLDFITSSTLDTIDFIKNNLNLFEQIKLGDVIGESLETAAGAISDFNDTALENTKNRLDAEKSSIENRYSIEEDILKSQLDNQLITESQFRQKQRELQKAQVAEENAIDRKIFDAEKKRDRQNATTDYLQAIASIIPTLIAYDKTADPVTVLQKAAITGGLATAAYGAELTAISQRKFFEKKFAKGGIVSGPSHEQGGVPFTVQGQGGYEMEGGEYIINKRATAMHRDLLERINKSGMTRPQSGRYRFAEGGLVNSPLNESVDYLKAIAEATTSTAIGVSKPVRAYVADKDLRTNANERRIRDRNDRI
jgi:hypothetical protein